MIENIREMIWELLSLNCKREDLIVCMSPIIEMLLVQQVVNDDYYWNGMPTHLEKLEGVEINSKWPYNEIVVYHKEKASYYPELLKKFYPIFNKKSSIELQNVQASVATDDDSSTKADKQMNNP